MPEVTELKPVTEVFRPPVPPDLRIETEKILDDDTAYRSVLEVSNLERMPQETLAELLRNFAVISGWGQEDD